VVFQNLLDVMQGEGGAAESKKGGKSTPPKWKFCEDFKGWDTLSSVHLIDRRPVAKSSVSMPATYLDITGDIRELYESLPESQVGGLSKKAFSLHLEGGRCPECKGRGEINMTMRFLADARIQCPVCRGKRFRNHVLDIKYNGLNISEVLALSIDEAISNFKNHRKIVQKLLPAQRMGLGYLKLGQPSASLSGGEAQRLKMVPFFTKKLGTGCVLILDEPTTGLHFEDVEKLIAVMRELVDAGATLLVVEHSEEVRRAADWQIEVGPKSAMAGGKLVFEGDPLKYNEKLVQ
jgi:excinuclease ABC subunit A